MSMIICAKDLGLTEVCSMGAIDAIDHGCVSAAAVYLNMPGTEYALRELAKRPWISLIWQVQDNAKADEPELEREILDCIRIYGKAPCAMMGDASAAAVRSVCDKYRIAHDWLEAEGPHPRISQIVQSSKGLGFDHFPEYDPAEQFGQIPEDDGIYFICCHPGFLDDISMAATLDEDYNVHRLADQRLLCSADFQSSLKEKHDLINLEDAFSGRCDFRNQTNDKH